MAMLRKVGELADVMIKNQLARQQAAYQSQLEQQRSNEEHQFNLQQEMVKNLAPGLTSGQFRLEDLPIDESHPLYQQLKLAAAAGGAAAPMRKQGAMSGVEQEMATAKDPGDLGDLGTRFEQFRTSNQKANGAPIDLTDVQNMSGAFNKRADVLGNEMATNQEAEAAKYEREHPDVTEITRTTNEQGVPTKDSVWDAKLNAFRPPTEEEMKHAHYDVRGPNAFLGSMQFADAVVHDLNAMKSFAQQHADTGALPTFYGNSGNMVKGKMAILEQFYDKNAQEGHKWDRLTPEVIGKLGLSDTSGGTGVTQDYANAKVDYDAKHKTVADLIGSYNAVGAYEKSAKLNAGLLKDTLKTIPSQNMPVFLNTKIRDLARDFGDETLARFEVYRQSVNKEYGRIITQPTLKGVFSVQAMLDSNQTMPEGATVGQYLAAADAFDKEAKNRQSGFRQQIQEARKGNPDLQPTPAPTVPQGVTIRRRQ